MSDAQPKQEARAPRVRAQARELAPEDTAHEIERGSGSVRRERSHPPNGRPPCPALALQQIAGNQAVARLLSGRRSPGLTPATIQAKLSVGPVSDRFERQADAMAARVVAMSAPSPAARRQTGKEEADLLLNRSAEPACPVQRGDKEGFRVAPAIEQRLAARKGSGTPLASETRAFMEPRFEADFSGVRVHTDAEARAISRELAADAFTHGTDIYMGEGTFDPATDAGKRLLAHELTHVVQQGTGGRGHTVQRQPESAAGPAGEQISETLGKAATPEPKGAALKVGEPRAMAAVTAMSILKRRYGAVKSIVQGTVVIVEDRAKLWAMYDNTSIRNGFKNWDTGKPWKKGDAERLFPGLTGFWSEGTSYVNERSPLITTTAHEILHNNCAADFRRKAGEKLDEGTTEHLAIQALEASNVRVGVLAFGYRDEVRLVSYLVDLVGEDTLVKAYFGGADSLINAYERVKGRGSWRILVGTVQGRNMWEARELLKLSSEAIDPYSHDVLEPAMSLTGSPEGGP